MFRHTVVAISAAAFALHGVAFAAGAAPLPRVVLAVDGTDQTRNLPVLLAERLGYFRAEGLTVTLVDAPAEPSPIQLMADGRADGAVAFYHHTFMSQATDHLVTQAVVTMGISPGLKVVVARRQKDQIHGLADLKGRRIYTGGSNSGKTTTANWIALHYGFGVAGYTALEPTERNAMAAALRDGTADAIVAHEPDASYYVANGGFELADVESAKGTVATLGSIYPSTALYLPEAYIAAYPDVVQRLVNACLKAVAFIKSHDADTVAAALPPKMAGKDKAAFVRLLAEDMQMFDTDGLMPDPAARAEWQAMVAKAPKYGAIQFERTYTNTFVRAAH